MEKPPGTGCLHLIRDVALVRAEGGYLAECHGCLTPLGFVTTPRDFQALRTAVMTKANPSKPEPSYRRAHRSGSPGL